MNFKQCPVCDAPIRVLWPTVAVWRCTNCKLLMRNPQPTEQELSSLYDESWTADVIEHLPRPVETIGQLGPYLSDNGWLFLATPNAAGISCRVKRAAWKEVRNPGHLYLFSPQNLELLLSKAGYSRPTRLRWYVQYSTNPARRALHTVLQRVAVDGELRYLAYKS